MRIAVVPFDGISRAARSARSIVSSTVIAGRGAPSPGSRPSGRRSGSGRLGEERLVEVRVRLGAAVSRILPIRSSSSAGSSPSTASSTSAAAPTAATRPSTTRTSAIEPSSRVAWRSRSGCIAAHGTAARITCPRRCRSASGGRRRRRGTRRRRPRSRGSDRTRCRTARRVSHVVAASRERSPPTSAGACPSTIDVRPALAGPRVEPRDRALEDPPAGVRSAAAGLCAVAEQPRARPGGGSAAARRRPSSRTRRASDPSACVASAGDRVCGGRRPGASSAGWPGLEREAEPAVVEVDLRVRLDEPRAEVRTRSTGSATRPSAARRRCTGRSCRRRRAAPASRRRSLRVDLAGRGRRSRRRARAPSARVVQHVGAVATRRLRRLDQQVRPPRVVRVGRQRRRRRSGEQRRRAEQ